MIKTAFCTVPSVVTEEDIKKEAASLPLFIRERNTAYINDILKKKHRPSALKSLMGLSLLGELISDIGITPRLLRTELGRPYFEDIPTVDFNISHSESLVACALCVSEDTVPRVGIDCEDFYQKDPIPIAKRFFTESEAKLILEAEDKKRAFTELWTKKEAYIKHLGTGLSTPPNSFEISDLSLHFETLEKNGNIITVCAEKELFER